MKQKMGLSQIVLGTMLAASLAAGTGYIAKDCNIQKVMDIKYEPETQTQGKKDYEPGIDIPVYLLF